MRRIGAASAVFLAVAALTGFTGAAATAAPSAAPVKGTWGSAVAVPGLGALSPEGVEVVTSISCTGPGDCTWKGAIQLPGSGKVIARNGSTVGEVSCASAATCEVGGTLQTMASSTRGFLVGETRSRWGKLYVVPDGIGSTITALSCPAPGYCAAGGQQINPSSASFPASTIAIDEVAGSWTKTVSLNDGYIGAPDTESVYAISCAAPRNCGAGGNLGGGKGRPYAFVANETPVK